MRNEPRRHIVFSVRFEKDIKRLFKKFKSIRQDLQPLISTLEQGETPGDQIQGVGLPVYKVRVRNRDLTRGKSGGYRVIYYIRTVNAIVLVTIYAKSEQEDISIEAVKQIIHEIEPR
jgi:mRNA-degrading endonuclease RelE of RelBE toxin-antitoxin system